LDVSTFCLGPHDPLNTDLGENRDNVSVAEGSAFDSLGELRSDYTTEPLRRREMAEGSRTTPPPPPPEPMDTDAPVRNLSSSSDLGKPIFSGEYKELKGLWFHMEVKQALDPYLAASDNRKCAYLASCLQGRALAWLTEKHDRRPAVLSDYAALVDAVNEAFDLPEDVKTRLAEKEIMQLRQTSSALHYHSDFDALVTRLSWPNSAKKALFFAGLKPILQERLIITDNLASYDEMKDEAIRLDSALSAPKVRSKKKEKSKCAKCGRTNHKTDECYAKKTVAVITTRDSSPASATSYLPDLPLQGQRLRGLVDSGAKINVMRASLARTQQFPSMEVIQDAIGRAMATCPPYVEDEIDGVIYKFYLIPGLLEEVILGEPYLDQGKNTRTLSLETTGPIPDGGRLRTLSKPEQDALEQYITDELKRGTIRPSNATSAANILFVPKKNGELRLCVDYRELNKITSRDGYVLPLLRDCIEKARGYEYYVVIDILRAFNLVRVRRGDEWKLAFKTNHGTFEYLAMPFGIKNGPSVFQRFIDQLLYRFRHFLVVYLDDILIFGNDIDVVEARLDVVRTHLAENQVPINEKKSGLVGREATFLGVRITKDCVTPVMHHETVWKWPVPRTRLQLQQFLGLANWYRDFTPNLGSILSPLYAHTGNAPWGFGEPERRAFDAAKEALVNSMSTYNFDPGEQAVWYTDASLFGLGAIMVQRGHVIAIVSRGLSPAERNYTTTEREVLAVVHAAKKWRHYSESARHPITVLTDHQAITQSLNSSGTNRRLNRWAEILMGANLSYSFVPGNTNPADFPSRRPDYEKEFMMRGGGEGDMFSEDDYPRSPWEET
jgi:hypothetical protein